MEKKWKMKWNLGLYRGYLCSIFFGGSYGTQYRVRLYPPCGGIVCYKRNVHLLDSTTTKHAGPEV